MRGCIFGAGEYCGERLDLCENALIIAADGGLRHTEAFSLTPSLIIGDFDSLGKIPTGRSVIRHPVEKDDTDMALAVKEALSRGCREIVMLGALGGRPDHTLANLTLLRALAREGVFAYLVGKEGVFSAMAAGERLQFDHAVGVLSLFSLTDEATVTVTGVKYPLSAGKLKAEVALGVSNEFTEKTAEIALLSGELLVFWEDVSLPLPKRRRMDA